MKRILPATVLVSLLWTSGTYAEPDAATGGHAPQSSDVVAKVGDRVVTARELEVRMSSIPGFQLATLGANSAAIRRKVLEDLLIPEILHELAAEKRKLGKVAKTVHQLDRVLAAASLRRASQVLGTAQSISDVEVAKYFAEHQNTYEAPLRIQVARILMKTESEAKALLEKAMKDPSWKYWTELSREHSIDKGTYLRSGILGFVSPDGSTGTSGLRVEPGLYQAALGVKDGEVVPKVVREGESYALVMRRGTLDAAKRSVSEVAPQIRDILHRQRSEAAEKSHLDALVAARVKMGDDFILAEIAVPLPELRVPKSAVSSPFPPK